MLRRILAVSSKIIVAVVLCYGLLLGVPYLIDRRAERAAADFCTAAIIDSEIMAVDVKAESSGIHHAVDASSSEHVFFFHGFVFDSAMCRIKVVDGKIASKISTKVID